MGKIIDLKDRIDCAVSASWGKKLFHKETELSAKDDWWALVCAQGRRITIKGNEWLYLLTWGTKLIILHVLGGK